MDRETLNLIAVSLFSIANLGLLIWQAVRKVPREVEKMRAEKDALYGDLAESNMQGAHISNELLLARIEELQRQRRAANKYIEMLEEHMAKNGITLLQRPDTDELLKKE